MTEPSRNIFAQVILANINYRDGFPIHLKFKLTALFRTK